MLREIDGPAGPLEVLLDEPSPDHGADDGLDRLTESGVRAAVVLGHPHTGFGGTMHTKALYQTAKALTRIGCAVLRFNFRGAGRSAGAFSDGPGEQDDFRAALEFMHARHPDRPLWAGGMSFGGWVALTVGARHPAVTTLIGVSLPVNRYDFEAAGASARAKFFVHGERDEICSVKDMRAFYARAREPKELVVIDAADHLFDGKTTEVGDAIEDLLGDWPG